MFRFILLLFVPVLVIAQKKPVSKARLVNTATASRQATITTLSGVRTWSGSPVPGFILTDRGRSGVYLLDESDKNTADDGGLTLVTANKLRYKLQHSGEVSISQFGCLPNDTVDDTQAIQKAVASGVPLTVPNGKFLISSSLLLTNKGDLSIRGQSKQAILQMNADKDMFVFTATANGGGVIEISNLTLFAGVNMKEGAAINIKGGIQRKVGTINNVDISRPDKNKEWKYGIRVTNPNELVLSNIVISGNNVEKMVGVEFTCTMAAVSPTLTNIKVYDGLFGFYVRSTTKPGLEGIKLQGCDFVGVKNGVDVQNTVSPAQYSPPGFQMQQCHINAAEYGITVNGYTQIEVASTICYGNGKTTGAGISMKDVSDVKIHNNQIQDVGASAMYGILLNFGTNERVNIYNNTLRLGDGNRSGVWLGPGTTKSSITDNGIEGLKGGSPVTDQGTNNTVRTNN